MSWPPGALLASRLDGRACSRRSSPGIRQVAFTYELPASAFPLDIRVDEPASVFEVLVQEPTTRVAGAWLRETPAGERGRTHVPALPRAGCRRGRRRCESICRVSSGLGRERVYFGVGALVHRGDADCARIRGASPRSAARHVVAAPEPPLAPPRT